MLELIVAAEVNQKPILQLQGQSMGSLTWWEIKMVVSSVNYVQLAPSIVCPFMRFDTFSLKSVNFHKHSKLKTVIQNSFYLCKGTLFILCFFPFLLLSVDSPSSDWLSFEITFL